MRWLHSILALAILLTLVASWTAWSAAFMRLRRGKPLLPAEPRRDVPWGFLELVICIVMFLGLPLLAVIGLRATTDLLPSLEPDKLTANAHSALLLCTSLASLVALGLAGLLVMLGARATWSDVGVSPRHTAIDLILGVAAFFMLAPLVYVVMLILVQWFPSEHPIVRLVKEDPRLFSLSFFSAVCVAPIVEEFMFRVLLQGWLERSDLLRLVRSFGKSLSDSATAPTIEPRSSDTLPPVVVTLDETRPAESTSPPSRMATSQSPNPYAPPSPESYGTAASPKAAEPEDETPSVKPPPFWPVLVSSTIFALLHWGHGPDPIPLFVLAVGLGYLYRQTHRVLPGIVVHVLLNAVSMLLLLLNVYAGVGK